MTSNEEIRIKSETCATYFHGMTAIGPQFGATRDKALVFEDGWEAYMTMKQFPLTVLADMVNGDDEPCDVTGKALGGDPR